MYIQFVWLYTSLLWWASSEIFVQRIMVRKWTKIPFGVRYNFSPLELGYFWFRLYFWPLQICPTTFPSWLAFHHTQVPPSKVVVPPLPVCPGGWQTQTPLVGVTETEQSVQCLLPLLRPLTCLSRGGWAIVYTRNCMKRGKERGNRQEGKQVSWEVEEEGRCGSSTFPGRRKRTRSQLYLLFFSTTACFWAQ